MGVLEVVAPQWLDLILVVHIPHGEADILVLTVSMLKPMVGMVVRISPSFSLFRTVVLEAASRPTMRMCISFSAKKALEEVCKDISHACGQVETILARDLAAAAPNQYIFLQYEPSMPHMPTGTIVARSLWSHQLHILVFEAQLHGKKYMPGNINLVKVLWLGKSQALVVSLLLFC